MRSVITTAVDDDGSIGFEVREERGPWGQVSLIFTGDFDHEANAVVDAVVDAVVGCVWAGAAVEVHVDLTGVTFLNGHGLAAMLTLQWAARVRGRTLVVRCLPGTVCRLLGLVGLTDHIREAHPAEAADGPGLRLVQGPVGDPGGLSARRTRRPARKVIHRWHRKGN